MTEILHILVIDDDPVMRSLLKSFLSLHKFRVDCVMTESDAIKVLHNNNVNVVITDLKIPGMNCVQLMRSITRTKAGVKIIAMGGDTSFERLPQDIKTTTPFIQKPFKLQEIEKLINKLTGFKPKPLDIY
ncbi:MAG: response regulator [Nitrospirae bacterium]|nr:response regulator [Nitrospirota bacterium]